MDRVDWKVTIDSRKRINLEFHVNGRFESSVQIKSWGQPYLWDSLQDQIDIDRDFNKA